MSMAMLTAAVWMVHPANQNESYLEQVGIQWPNHPRPTDDGDDGAQLDSPLPSDPIGSVSRDQSSDCYQFVTSGA
jgi:hypothetical protein